MFVGNADVAAAADVIVASGGPLFVDAEILGRFDELCSVSSLALNMECGRTMLVSGTSSCTVAVTSLSPLRQLYLSSQPSSGSLFTEPGDNSAGVFVPDLLRSTTSRGCSAVLLVICCGVVASEVCSDMVVEWKEGFGCLFNPLADNQERNVGTRGD